MSEPSSYQFAILMALKRLRKPGEVYAGTVPPKTRMQRRGTWGAYRRRRAALHRRFVVAQRAATVYGRTA